MKIIIKTILFLMGVSEIAFCDNEIYSKDLKTENGNERFVIKRELRIPEIFDGEKFVKKNYGVRQSV